MRLTIMRIMHTIHTMLKKFDSMSDEQFARACSFLLLSAAFITVLSLIIAGYMIANVIQ